MSIALTVSSKNFFEENSSTVQFRCQFVILEMEDSDYFDYESLAQASKYTVIPYKKVVQLTYKKNDSKILFKLDFILLKENYKTVPELQVLGLHSTVTAGKIADTQCVGLNVWLFVIIELYVNCFTACKHS